MYRKPVRSNLESFYNCFEDILQKYSKNILIGDYNLDLLDLESNDVNKYKIIVNCNGFVILNKVSKKMNTRPGSMTIIDHVVTDMLNHDYNVTINECDLTDHNGISVGLNINTITQNIESVKQSLNFCKLVENLKNENMENVNSFTDFHETVIKNVKKNKYTKKVKNCNIKIKKSFLTSEIVDLSKEKFKYYKLMKKYPENNLFTTKYIELRNQIPNLIRTAKKFFTGIKDSSRCSGIQVW